jgi:hypothetical protein
MLLLDSIAPEKVGTVKEILLDWRKFARLTDARKEFKKIPCV